MESKTLIAARYSEPDKMGIVHHSRYYPWFEIARGDFIKQYGITYKTMEEDGLYMPLTECSAKYYNGVLYDDVVEVVCRMSKATVVRCVFEYEVIRVSDGQLMTKGTTTHAFCDRNLKPVNIKKKFPKYYDLISEFIKGRGDK